MAAISYCGRCLSTFDGNPDACPNLGCKSGRPGPGWGTVLGEGDVLDRRYLVERCLAVGGAGLTYLGREIDGSGQPIGPRVAIKVLYAARASGPFLRRLSNEAQILQELAHDNIVELLGFVHRAGHEPYLVTRFEEGGSLAQHVERHARHPGDWVLRPPVAAAILRQVLLGLDVAHQRGVVHRDLKPDNVLLDAPADRDGIPRIRVADFGIAKIAGGMGDRLTRMGAFVGTPEYAAPEQFEGLNPTAATDVFAAGALFVYLLTGEPPFRFSHRGDISTTYEELLAQVPLPIERVIPPRAEVDPATAAVIQEVVANTLIIDPGGRYTIHRVLSALGPLLDPSVRSDNLRTIDVSTSRLVAPRASVPPAADHPPAPPPTLGPPAGLSAPRTAAPAVSLDLPPAPPPTVGGLETDEVDTDVAPPPLPPPPMLPPPLPPGNSGADTDVSAVRAPAPPPPPPSTLPPDDGDPGSSRIEASPRRPSLDGEDLATEEAERRRAAQDEDDATVEAPSDAPPPSVPLTGPGSYVGMRLGERQPASATAIPDETSNAPSPAPSPSRPVRPTAEVAPPPPFVPSLAPTPSPFAPAPPPEPVVAPRAEPAGRGGTAGLAGCFGLSLVGMAAVGTGGFVAVALVLLVIAGATGWFGDPLGGGGGEVVVGDQDPPRFERASPLPERDRAKVEKAVRRTKDDIGRKCGRGASVRSELLVEPSGKVVYAKVLGDLGAINRDCVRRGLERVSVPEGVATEGIARVEFGL